MNFRFQQGIGVFAGLEGKGLLTVDTGFSVERFFLDFIQDVASFPLGRSLYLGDQQLVFSNGDLGILGDKASFRFQVAPQSLRVHERVECAGREQGQLFDLKWGLFVSGGFARFFRDEFEGADQF